MTLLEKNPVTHPQGSSDPAKRSASSCARADTTVRKDWSLPLLRRLRWSPPYLLFCGTFKGRASRPTQQRRLLRNARVTSPALHSVLRPRDSQFMPYAQVVVRVEIQHLLVVIYSFLSLPKLPQAEGQPLASTHIGTDLQDAPEIARIFLERFSSQRPLSGLDTLLVELPGFLQTPGVLLGQ